MIIDPIGDMLNRIRNAILCGASQVEIPASKLKEAVLRILKQENYVLDFKRIKQSKSHSIINISLAGDIHHLERVSKPGLRVYVAANRIPRVISGLGMVIISTSQGIMTGKQAKKKGIGGEIICRIW